MIGQPATIGALLDMAPRLRAEDTRELQDFTGLSPADALLASLRVSRYCRVMRHMGKPTLAYGVSDDPQDARRGSVWLVATPDVSHIAKSFLGAVPAILEAFHALYPAGLHAYADRRNVTHLRWLRAAGFSLEDLGGLFIHATHSR